MPDRGGEHAGADVADVRPARAGPGACRPRRTARAAAGRRRRPRRARAAAGPGSSTVSARSAVLERHDARRRRRRRPRARGPAASSQRLRVVGDEHPAAVAGDARSGTTSYASRSIARSTPAAVAQETACSRERPPKTMATRGRRPAGPGSGSGRGQVLIGRTLSPAIRSPVARVPALRLACAPWTTCTPRPRPRLDPRRRAGRPAARARGAGERPARALLDVRRRRPGQLRPRRQPHLDGVRGGARGAGGRRRPGLRLGHGGRRRGPVARPRRAASSWHRRTPTTAPA